MKKNLFLGAFVLFSLGVMAQSKDEQVVATVTTLFNKAIADADSAALVSLTSTQLSYGHSNGKAEDKSTFIQTVLHGPIDVLSFDVSAQQITIAGKEAIVRHIFSAKITNNGTPGELKIGALLVFTKQKGNWLLLARQGYKL